MRATLAFNGLKGGDSFNVIFVKIIFKKSFVALFSKLYGSDWGLEFVARHGWLTANRRNNQKSRIHWIEA